MEEEETALKLGGYWFPIIETLASKALSG